jgi:queuine tRNA-ribosyltransferase subunit QTRTD1
MSTPPALLTFYPTCSCINSLFRLRGYQLPANGPNQPRRMPKAYGLLDGAIQKFAASQSEVATPDTGADGLEEHGFAEKA